MTSLAELIDPRHTAILTSECQRGIVGSESPVKAIAEAVRTGAVLERIGDLLEAARLVRIPVVHCTVVTRRDFGGSSANCRLLAFARAAGEGTLTPQADAAQIASALGPVEDDFVIARLHGVSPFDGTELDSILRNLGVRSIVATGVSLNVALLGLTFEAVNRGYQVVLPRDATAGTPPEYVDLLLKHTLRLLATITTAAEVLEVWREAARPAAK
jgi:nicotinamidase-related amidase